jgi:hypothetical protein
LIPKKIHYCWLSGEEMPQDILHCIDSWKGLMPDYELVCWDKNKFDLNAIPFVRECCRVKKWAFASDYIRLFAVYNEGGIYLDTDMLARKPFDDLLKYGFFISIEQNYPRVNNGKERFSLQAAAFGSIKGHPFLKKCMEWYETHHYNTSGYNQTIIAPDVYMQVARNFGFKNTYLPQMLSDNMAILPAYYFTNDMDYGRDAYALHLSFRAWKNEPFIKRILGKRLRKLLGLDLPPQAGYKPFEKLKIFENFWDETKSL